MTEGNEDVGSRARWSRKLAQAMVDADLSIDAAAQLWGLDRVKVQRLLRSDTAPRPIQVVEWVEMQARRAR